MFGSKTEYAYIYANTFILTKFNAHRPAPKTLSSSIIV